MVDLTSIVEHAPNAHNAAQYIQEYAPAILGVCVAGIIASCYGLYRCINRMEKETQERILEIRTRPGCVIDASKINDGEQLP